MQLLQASSCSNLPSAPALAAMLAAALCSVVSLAAVAAAWCGQKALQKLQATTVQSVEALYGAQVALQMHLQNHMDKVVTSIDAGTDVQLQALQVLKMMEMRLQWLESSFQDGICAICIEVCACVCVLRCLRAGRKN